MIKKLTTLIAVVSLPVQAAQITEDMFTLYACGKIYQKVAISNPEMEGSERVSQLSEFMIDTYEGQGGDVFDEKMNVYVDNFVNQTIVQMNTGQIPMKSVVSTCMQTLGKFK